MVFEASMEPFPGSFLSAEHLATEDGYYVNNLQESIEVTTGRGLTFGYDYFGNFGLSLFLGMASKKELCVMPRDLFSPKKVFTLSYLLIECWTWNAPRFLHFSTPEGARVEIGSCRHQGSPCFKWLQEIPGQLPSRWLGQQCTVVGTGPSSKFPWKDCNHEWDRLWYLDNYYLVRGSLTTVQSVINVALSYVQRYLYTHIYIYIETCKHIYKYLYVYEGERETSIDG